MDKWVCKHSSEFQEVHADGSYGGCCAYWCSLCGAFKNDGEDWKLPMWQPDSASNDLP